MSEAQKDAGGRDGARMAHSGTRQLYAYWDRLRGARTAPERREIEPGDIAAILSDTFILETARNGTYPYRLAGSRVCSVFGRELKGEDWLAGWNPRDGEALSTLLRSVVTQGAGAVVELEGRNARGHGVPVEVLLLPLLAGGPGYRRILGSLLPLDRPYWLGSWPVVERAVTSLRLIWPHQGGSGRDSGRDGPDHLLEIMLPLRRLRHLALYDGGRPD